MEYDIAVSSITSKIKYYHANFIKPYIPYIFEENEYLKLLVDTVNNSLEMQFTAHNFNPNQFAQDHDIFGTSEIEKCPPGRKMRSIKCGSCKIKLSKASVECRYCGR